MAEALHDQRTEAGFSAGFGDDASVMLSVEQSVTFHIPKKIFPYLLKECVHIVCF